MTAFRAVLPRFKELCVATICRGLKGLHSLLTLTYQL